MIYTVYLPLLDVIDGAPVTLDPYGSNVLLAAS